MDFATYITSIDWASALAIAAVLVIVGLVLLRFMLATSAEIGSMLPGAGGVAGHAILDARELPSDSWVCTTCRSVNTPQAGRCYRGCGARDALAAPLPADRSLIAEGKNGRRAR